MTKPWLNSNYTNLGVNITFSRLLTSSLLTIYIPSTLIVSLSWVSFWIDVQGIPGRISLGIMSVLTVITQILDIRKNMPPVSYVTAIDIWLFICLIAVFLSLVEYAFAYNYVRKVTLNVRTSGMTLTAFFSFCLLFQTAGSWMILLNHTKRSKPRSK